MNFLSTPRILRYLLAGIIFGFALIILHEAVPILGVNSPAVDPMMDFVKGGFWGMVFLFLLFTFPAYSEERGALVLLWFARIFTTLCIMLFYEFKYDKSLDAYYYYKVAIQGLANNHNWLQMRSTDLIGHIANFFNWALPFMDSYHALKVLWAFFGLIGIYFFYLAYENYVGKRDIKLLLLLGLFPSIAFWSSILGKDPLTFLGIGISFYCFLGLLKKFRFHYLALLPFGLFTLHLIRPWLVGLFVIPFAIVFTLRSRIHVVYKVALSVAVVFVLGFTTDFVSNYFQINSQQELVETSHELSRKWAFGGSGNQVAEIRSLSDFLKFLPTGMFTALYRPMPGEVLNLFGLFSGVESVVLLLFLIVSLLKARMSVFSDPLVQLSIFTLVVWSSAYGFISIQNMGTAVRFKLQVLPIMIILPYYILHLSNQEKESGDSEESVSEQAS